MEYEVTFSKWQEYANGKTIVGVDPNTITLTEEALKDFKKSNKALGFKWLYRCKDACGRWCSVYKRKVESLSTKERKVFMKIRITKL